jgi:hypothetical protein
MQQSLATPVAPAFLAYAFTCLVLSLNLLTLWVSSGAIRATGGVAINPEDGVRYSAPVGIVMSGRRPLIKDFFAVLR